MSTIDEVFAELAERLEEDYPRAWIPGAAQEGFPVDGDTIMGTVVRMDSSRTRKGETARILVLADTAGELRSVWLLHAAAVSKVDGAELVPGDMVALRRLDKRVSETSGLEYFDYKIVVKRASSQAPAPPADLPTPDDSPQDEAPIATPPDDFPQDEAPIATPPAAEAPPLVVPDMPAETPPPAGAPTA